MVVCSQPSIISGPSLEEPHSPCSPNEKVHHQHLDTETESLAHAHRCRCDRARPPRRARTAALLSAAALCALLILSLALDVFSEFEAISEALGLGTGSVHHIAKRQSNGAVGSGTSNNTFVHNKLYLIIVFVGLFLVVIMGICLSAWCCRGSFENPLCCPCYLCACCGGLACLECIGCGLCAEGLDQV